jgi:hypothetical protein
MASLLTPLEPRELIHLGCGEGYCVFPRMAIAQ